MARVNVDILGISELKWTGGSGDCTGDRDKDHPQEKEMQKSKMVI